MGQQLKLLHVNNMKIIIAILSFTSLFMSAEEEKFVVSLFSEVRIEKEDAGYPEGKKVEYGFKFEGYYSTDDKMERLTLEGISKMTTFHSSEEIHPAVGKPFYLVVLDKGKLTGSVIKFFEGPGSGFYLIQGFEVDEKGSLINGLGQKIISPLTSKPFASLFQKVISEVSE